MTRTAIYVKISDEELKAVDEIAKKLGYANRTEILTDITQSLIYGKPFRKETVELNELLTLGNEVDRLRDTFMDIIDEYAFPVVAMYGADHAYKVLKDDLKTWMYQRCQAVPHEQDMKDWIHSYYASKKGSIQRYRIKTITEQYAEEHDTEETS